MSEHTPLPWVKRHSYNIFAGDTAAVARTDVANRSPAVLEANARLIVTAVNSHAALVEAAEETVAAFDSTTFAGMRHGKSRLFNSIATLIAALALTKETE